MAILTYTPRGPLATFVDNFWYYDRDAQQHTKELIVPTGDVKLIFNLRDDLLRVYDTRSAGCSETFRGPLLWGPHSEQSIWSTTPGASFLGVRFKPGSALPFFGEPAGEFYRRKVTLRDFWGLAADELRDRVFEAKTPFSRFRILERFLLRRVQGPQTCHPAVTYALGQFQAMSQDRKISEVTKHTGFSQRWLIASFRAQVGLTPKLYCRLRRFRAALTLIGQRPLPDWADLACACGYFDQAHFIRDFRAFSGLTPTSYLANRTECQNHVRLSS